MKRAALALFALLCMVAPLRAQQGEFSFQVTQNWGSGYQGEIRIKNVGAQSVVDWGLSFDFASEITSIWDATLVSRVGQRTTVSHGGWNREIAPGATVSFGFVGLPGGTVAPPTNFQLTGGSGGGGGGGGGGGSANGAPATPTLSILANQDGSATVVWTIWGGNNATQWDLQENGSRIHRANLPDGTPNSQRVEYRLTGRDYAANEYRVVVRNAHGVSRSNVVPFTFGGASKLVVVGLDGANQATMASVPLLQERRYDLKMLGFNRPTVSVIASNPSVVAAASNGATLTLVGLRPGRASLKLREENTGETRYLGVRVLEPNGAIPGAPVPAIGSVSEDTTEDLEFWRGFDEPQRGRRMDVRYIYLNGGPFNGWRTWHPIDGFRVISYLRESQKLGIIPYFVWYNIPDGGESYWINREHIADRDYMRAYFRDLRFTLELIQKYAPDEPVGMILEPDFLGYMMQMSGLQPGQIPAQTRAVYDEGVLTKGVDPNFGNHVTGLVKAINYTIAKYAPNVRFGWQFNLWASPGIHVVVPAKGLMRITDTMGIDAGRAAIQKETEAIAAYYRNAGVTSSGAHFVSIDKYGLDAGAQPGAAQDPAGSTWFWNADHWNNYLLFTKTLKAKTKLPVVLWQLPVGRINSSLAISPYTGQRFDDLPNTHRRFEDSAPTFFFGDRFTATGARLAYFGENRGGDKKIKVSGNVVTWGEHISAAQKSGVTMLLFGAGVGESTDGVGSPPTDDWWWIAKAQEFLARR
ncbi:MAG: cellulose binding domain-containing protein [Fimbriimonadaceae bacterium]